MSDSPNVNFGIVFHNHQPVGNFPWVFEQAFRQAYLPMLEAIEKHPSISLSVHYSGPLVDWLVENHPDFLHRLARLVSSGQVEVLSGGYFEPILPSLPDADKIGQIKKMNSFIQDTLGVKPTGMWLAERVWEPQLARILARAGIEWTLVDDTHFKWVGLEDKDLFGYYKSEEQGEYVKIFPISKYLRYSIPWRSVDEVIGFFRNEASSLETRIAVLGDDGEKFGVWPGTYKHCWEEGWVERFFSALEKNAEWLRTVKLGDYGSQTLPRGRIYLPCAAYDEMLEWALPVEKSWLLSESKQQLEKEGRHELLQFLRGGFWRHFLVKYPEANRLHKKMMRVHRKVYAALEKGIKDPGLCELWKAQCNEPYWHGVFGGVYLADLRATAYRHLIEAENKAAPVREGGGRGQFFEWEEVDFDGDGRQEVLVEGRGNVLYISPAEGGTVFEWDLRGHKHNLASTLARRPEAYHHAITGLTQSAVPDHGKLPSIHDGVRIKDVSGLAPLAYDRNPRSVFLDHFFGSSTKIGDLITGAYSELGDFTGNEYTAFVAAEGQELRISMNCQGFLKEGTGLLSFKVEKQIRLRDGSEGLLVEYRITNTSDTRVEAVFGSECNFNLLGGGHNDAAYYEIPGATLEERYLDSQGGLDGIGRIDLRNESLDIMMTVKISPKVNLWRFPVQTISNSEMGIEGLYQASCLVFLLPFNLGPGQSTHLVLDFSIS